MELMNLDPAAWERLGRLLRDAREKDGLTRKEFAAKADVSEKAVYNAEEGPPPKKQQPPTLVKIAIGHGWKPESIKVILDGGNPIKEQPEADTPAPAQIPPAHPELVELMLKVYEFGRMCTSLGGNPEARDQFEAAAQQLFASVPRAVRASTKDDLTLAAYRPHALGEGVPADDAEAILRAMEED